MNDQTISKDIFKTDVNLTTVPVDVTVFFVGSFLGWSCSWLWPTKKWRSQHHPRPEASPAAWMVPSPKYAGTVAHRASRRSLSSPRTHAVDLAVGHQPTATLAGEPRGSTQRRGVAVLCGLAPQVASWLVSMCFSKPTNSAHHGTSATELDARQRVRTSPSRAPALQSHRAPRTAWTQRSASCASDVWVAGRLKSWDLDEVTKDHQEPTSFCRSSRTLQLRRTASSSLCTSADSEPGCWLQLPGCRRAAPGVLCLCRLHHHAKPNWSDCIKKNLRRVRGVSTPMRCDEIPEHPCKLQRRPVWHFTKRLDCAMHL